MERKTPIVCECGDVIGYTENKPTLVSTGALCGTCAAIYRMERKEKFVLGVGAGDGQAKGESSGCLTRSPNCIGCGFPHGGLCGPCYRLNFG